MLRSLFGRGRRRGPGKQDPWEALVAASPSAAGEADKSTTAVALLFAGFVLVFMIEVLL